MICMIHLVLLNSQFLSFFQAALQFELAIMDLLHNTTCIRGTARRAIEFYREGKLHKKLDKGLRHKWDVHKFLAISQLQIAKPISSLFCTMKRSLQLRTSHMYAASAAAPWTGEVNLRLRKTASESNQATVVEGTATPTGRRSPHQVRLKISM